MTRTPSRRQVLVAGTGVAAVAVAGCASASAGGGGGTTSPAAAGQAGSTSSPSSPPSPSPSPSPTGLIALAAVPLGGAASATGPDGPAVVAQPTAGTVVAFSARCTHRGCTVAPAGQRYECPCHGSVYDAFTGAVLQGPAPAALAKLPVRVEAGQVVTA